MPTGSTARRVQQYRRVDAGRCTGPFPSKLFFSVLPITRMLSKVRTCSIVRTLPTRSAVMFQEGPSGAGHE